MRGSSGGLLGTCHLRSWQDSSKLRLEAIPFLTDPQGPPRLTRRLAPAAGQRVGGTQLRHPQAVVAALQQADGLLLPDPERVEKGLGLAAPTALSAAALPPSALRALKRNLPQPGFWRRGVAGERRTRRRQAEAAAVVPGWRNAAAAAGQGRHASDHHLLPLVLLLLLVLLMVRRPCRCSRCAPHRCQIPRCPRRCCLVPVIHRRLVSHLVSERLTVSQAPGGGPCRGERKVLASGRVGAAVQQALRGVEAVKHAPQGAASGRHWCRRVAVAAGIAPSRRVLEAIVCCRRQRHSNGQHGAAAVRCSNVVGCPGAGCMLEGRRTVAGSRSIAGREGKGAGCTRGQHGDVEWAPGYRQPAAAAGSGGAGLRQLPLLKAGRGTRGGGVLDLDCELGRCRGRGRCWLGFGLPCRWRCWRCCLGRRRCHRSAAADCHLLLLALVRRLLGRSLRRCCAPRWRVGRHQRGIAGLALLRLPQDGPLAFAATSCCSANLPWRLLRRRRRTRLAAGRVPGPRRLPGCLQLGHRHLLACFGWLQRSSSS